MASLGNTAPRDPNQIPALLGTSSSDGKTVTIYANPVTHRLLVDSGGGGSSLTVTDGVTTVTSVTTLDFTSGATVTDGGGGTADVAISGSGSGTVTEVDTGTGLTGGPITTTGTVSLDSKLSPMDTLTGNSLKVLRVNAGETAVEYATPTAGTVTAVSVATANGFAGTSSGGATPALTLTTTVNSPALAGDGTSIAAATTTGSGSTVVLATSPTITTPTIGTNFTFTTGAPVIKDANGNNLLLFAVNASSVNYIQIGNAASGNPATITGVGSNGLTIASTGTLTLTNPNVGTQTAGNNTTLAASTAFVTTAVAGATGLTVGTTTIASGTSTRILYDNAGVLGEYTLTGSGTVVAMQTAPTFVTSITSPLVIGGSGTTGTQLTLQTTTGNGTTDALVIKGGNNGASTFATFTTGGALTLSTSGTLTTGTVELGAATDTTLSRSSAGVLAVEGVVIPSISSTNTLTNKRITRRTATTNAPGATPTTNSDNVDYQVFTGLGTAITSMSTNLSGTPVAGDFLEFWLTDNGTARAITWGASFAATTVALPTTTVISTKLRVLFEWGGSTWDCVAVA